MPKQKKIPKKKKISQVKEAASNRRVTKKKPRRTIKNKHVILFVHGTFAGKGETDALGYDGVLAKALKKTLPNKYALPSSENKSFSFTWSGKNTEEERVRAAESLKSVLIGLDANEDIPGYSVIGHSHGGTVIWLALQLLANRKDELPTLRNIRNWITVGTPFYRHGLRMTKAATRNFIQDYAEKWKGICHPLDEAVGGLRSIQKLRISLPETYPILTRLGFSIGSGIVKHFGSRAALGNTPGRLDVSLCPPEIHGVGTPKSYYPKLRTDTLLNLSDSNFESDGKAIFRSLREAIATGDVGEIPKRADFTKGTRFLIHCLYFESRDTIDIISEFIEKTNRQSATRKWARETFKK